MQRLKVQKLIRDVCQYEKSTGVDSDFLRKVLVWVAVVLAIMNFRFNGLEKPTVFMLTNGICILALISAAFLHRKKAMQAFILATSFIVVLMGVVFLLMNENDGFQNFWFFLLPTVFIIQVGLRMALPICAGYGLCITVVLWFAPKWVMVPYPREYCIYYPVFYWAFLFLMVVADLFYKYYRICRERAEREMEQEVQATVAKAQKLMFSSVVAISQMVDEKDRYTSEHSHRVAEYSCRIARCLGGKYNDEKELGMLYRSALLHDIGKISVPDAILNKPSRLTEEEFAIMKQHTVWGRKILAGIEFLPQADAGASYHHERYAGGGYPTGVPSAELPEIVRIISAADALDAMSSDRCYRKKCDKDYIIGEFRKNSGKQFDPAIADIVIQLIQSGEIPLGQTTGCVE